MNTQVQDTKGLEFQPELKLLAVFDKVVANFENCSHSAREVEILAKQSELFGYFYLVSFQDSFGTRLGKASIDVMSEYTLTVKRFSPAIDDSYSIQDAAAFLGFQL